MNKVKGRPTKYSKEFLGRIVYAVLADQRKAIQLKIPKGGKATSMIVQISKTAKAAGYRFHYMTDGETLTIWYWSEIPADAC
jgi:hypothetical protein